MNSTAVPSGIFDEKHSNPADFERLLVGGVAGPVMRRWVSSRSRTESETLWIPVMPRRAGLSAAGLARKREQLDHQSAQQATDDPALLLAGGVQHRVERLPGDQGFEDDVHAEHIAVERQRAIHVGHPDDEMAERHVARTPEFSSVMVSPPRDR